MIFITSIDDRKFTLNSINSTTAILFVSWLNISLFSEFDQLIHWLTDKEGIIDKYAVC